MLIGVFSPQKSKYAVRDRVIEFALYKKEEGPYWERLLKDKTKQHWLKIDFNKWKNEDDSDDEAAGGGGGGGGDLEEVSLSLRRIHSKYGGRSRTPEGCPDTQPLVPVIFDS